MNLLYFRSIVYFSSTAATNLEGVIISAMKGDLFMKTDRDASVFQRQCPIDAWQQERAMLPTHPLEIL